MNARVQFENYLLSQPVERPDGGHVEEGEHDEGDEGGEYGVQPDAVDAVIGGVPAQPGGVHAQVRLLAPHLEHQRGGGVGRR